MDTDTHGSPVHQHIGPTLLAVLGPTSTIDPVLIAQDAQTAASAFMNATAPMTLDIPTAHEPPHQAAPEPISSTDEEI